MSALSKKLMIVFSFIFTLTVCLRCDNPETTNEHQTEIVAESTPSILPEVKTLIYRKPIVFIAGFDKGNETFYSNARAYFNEKGLKVIDGQYSLEEIITWLNTNANKNPYGEIHIVNNSNPYKEMNLETIINGEKITAETLRKNITQGTLPTLKNVVNKNSKIIFHVSGLINNVELMKTLRDALSAKELPKVVASPYYTIFGGKFSNHYLAKPYCVFYPTANSPGVTDLSKEIARKYPEEKDIDWYDALNNEEERYVGEAYTTQFSIPIQWEFDYHNSDDEIPTFTLQEEVMDWIEQQDKLVIELAKYKLPLEKFRWNWTVKNSKLTIRGRTTGLCVLKPLIKPYGDLKYLEPDTNNKRLYAMKQ